MLELKNLTKIYHSEDEGSLALSGISITFPEIGFVAITGESGSGKTTLLNVLSGFTTYEEGDFFVDGVDFLSFSEEDLETYRKNDIGFVFQDYHLIENYTVIDNLISALAIVGVNSKTAKEKSLAILEKFGLKEHAYAKARSLSSGQKQKLAIARAIIKEPKIVLCDEPTANLDPESGIKILEVLKEYSLNHLVIVSTHNYEDAQEYVTHFVRLYNGNLTAYEEVKKETIDKENDLDKGQPNSLMMFFIYLKNQLGKMISKTAFFSLFVTSLTFLIVLFAANIDDSTTKILSRELFNNINQNEVLVMRKDREVMSEEELSTLHSIKHVTGTQLYGLATEMNYFYRENIDYEYQIIIAKKEMGLPDYPPGTIIEYTEYQFHTLRDDMYIKSYQGMVTATDLKEGQLPEGYNDILVYGNYKIGDEVKVFLYDPVMQNNSYFEFKFNVVGLLNKESEDAYFSPIFVKSIDYMQSNAADPVFCFNIDYNVKNKRNNRTEERLMPIYMTPIYNPSLKPDEIQLSKQIVEMGIPNFPSVDDINFTFVDYRRVTGSRVDVNLAEDPFGADIPLNYAYVGENIFHSYIDNHVSRTSRVYVDNYPYVDEVINTLSNKKYDCLSEFRAGSMEYDTQKQNQRAVILIMSLSLIIVVSLIYYFFGYLSEKNRLNDDQTMCYLGSSISSTLQVSLLEISTANAMGFVIGSLIYLILSLLPIPFIKSINLYLRFYHILIVLLIVGIINVLIWLRYNRTLVSMMRKVKRN